MAASSFALTAVVQDALQLPEPAQQQAANNVTPVNANQAQGAPAPADTVTLTNQTAEGHQTGADSNGGHFDQAAFLGASAGYPGTISSRPNEQPSRRALPLLLPQTQTQNAPPATANTATNTAGDTNAAANTAANSANVANAATAPTTAANATAADPTASNNDTTPQQQLQQLDQSLQQLGISPQSIPLFNRMAMLLYANDPAALRLLVQTMQGAATQQSAAQAPNATGNSNEAAAQALLPAVAPANQGQVAAQPASATNVLQTQALASQEQPQLANPPQSQNAQTVEQLDVTAMQISFAGARAASLPAQTAATQPTGAAATDTASNTQAAQPSVLTVQIEELQVAFQSIDIQQGPFQLNGSSGPSQNGDALNVTA